jgi:hypothetical protein
VSADAIARVSSSLRRHIFAAARPNRPPNALCNAERGEPWTNRQDAALTH